jgi:hypothetical protein
MKKGIYITLGIIATAGLSYFIYTKIRDRNKEIIQEGGFTIKVSADATTTDANPTDNGYGNGSDSYDYGNGSYDYGSETTEEPEWSSDSIYGGDINSGDYVGGIY